MRWAARGARKAGRAAAAAVGIALTPGLVGCGGAEHGSDTVDVWVRMATERFTLPNGLDVVLHADGATDSVHAQLRVHAGSSDDPRGREGLAHLVEHLVFDGAPALADGRDEALTAKMGAVENASTSFESTDYFLTVPPDHVSRALWMLAQRFAHPAEALDEPTFRREQRVVLNEWRQREHDAAYGATAALLLADLYAPGHPYAHAPVGSPTAFGAATLADVRAFVAEHYVARRATLAVTGRFDQRLVRRRVAEWFGGVTAGVARPPVELARELPPVRAARRDVPAGVRYPRVVHGWTALPGRDGWGQAASLGFERLGSVAQEVAKQRHGAKVRGVETWELLLPRGGVRALVVELDAGVGADDAGAIAGDVLGDGVARLAWHDGRDWNPRHAGLVTQTLFALEHPAGRAVRLLDDVDAFGRTDVVSREMHARFALDASQVREAVLTQVVARAPVVHHWVPTDGAPPGGAR